MGTESIKTSATIGASPQRIYDAWMSAHEHALFTGSAATMDARVGGKFSAWDGYAEGENLVLEPGKLIVQAWRSSDFPKNASHSRLEVRLEKCEGGTKVTLVHSDIPAGQAAEYKRGWIVYYFTPMKTYFGGAEGATKVSRKSATKKKSAATATKSKKREASSKARVPKKTARLSKK